MCVCVCVVIITILGELMLSEDLYGGIVRMCVCKCVVVIFLVVDHDYTGGK